MRFDQPEAFRASLEARLRHEASGSERDLLRLRRTVAFDRFLARLAIYQPGAWVLKGGAALEFRMPDRARATRDIDLAFSGSETAETAIEHLIDALGEDPFGDFFGFRVTRNRKLGTAPDRGPVVRLSIDVSLGGRLFERLVVDVVSAEGRTSSTSCCSSNTAWPQTTACSERCSRRSHPATSERRERCCRRWPIPGPYHSWS